MKDYLDRIIKNKLWVKVIVYVGNKQSSKVLKLIAYDDNILTFKYPKDIDCNIMGDDLYRIFSINSVAHFKNNTLPEFHMMNNHLPVVSKLPIVS
jgi:hypothetical protein